MESFIFCAVQVFGSKSPTPSDLNCEPVSSESTIYESKSCET